MRSIARGRLAAPAPLCSCALLVALLLGTGCSSTDAKKGPRRGEPEPYVPLAPEGPQPIGYFLAQFDRSLVQWSELKMNSSSKRELSALRALELDMQKRARKRRDELVETLETGAPANRRIAAAALGFTHDPTVLGPLLASLSDPDPEVAQKALLALGVLALPETPLGGILARLREDPAAWTRNNAAFALLALADAGVLSSELGDGCRAALADPEPGVRAQCASALGAMADEDSVERLSELLYDDANLVALAAMTSLARIGRRHAEQKGTVARALAGALEQVGPDRREQLLDALRWLAEIDMGEDAGPWLKWAHDMP